MRVNPVYTTAALLIAVCLTALTLTGCSGTSRLVSAAQPEYQDAATCASLATATTTVSNGGYGPGQLYTPIAQVTGLIRDAAPGVLSAGFRRDALAVTDAAPGTRPSTAQVGRLQADCRKLGTAGRIWPAALTEPPPCAPADLTCLMAG